MSSEAVPARLTPVEAHEFRLACSRFATGVAVVTTVDLAGNPHGVTVNSFSSVSLDPPLVLFCMDFRNSLLGSLGIGRHCAVNVLSEDQKELSIRFARQNEDRFGPTPWYASETGAPLFPSALAMLECEIRHQVDAGDHVVLIAKVLAVTAGDGQPLIYFNSTYQKLGGLHQ